MSQNFNKTNLYPNNVTSISDRPLVKMNGKPAVQESNQGTPCSEAKPDPDRQVYECSAEGCHSQAWMLFEEGVIKCGKCEAVNQFMHREPAKRVVDYFKRKPRLRMSYLLKKMAFACARCGFNGFHLHASGTITCFRCRHASAFKHYNPDES